jgi:hypothetical protein
VSYCETVQQLIEALSRFPADAPVIGTWEGQAEAVSVYQAKNGTVIIDVDADNYRHLFEGGQLSPV